MTEADWLSSNGYELMEKFLGARVTERKSRLLACACCRLLGKFIEHPAAAQAIDAVERYADGVATAAEVAAAAVAARAAAKRQTSEIRRVAIMATVWAAEDRITIARTGECVRCVAHEGLPAGWPEQSALLCDVFGNPFRPVVFSPSWRTSTVVALARQMYESRDFSAMPILADALQDAGCADAEVLAHCRGAGPHVRGCWVVDLTLGKE